MANLAKLHSYNPFIKQEDPSSRSLLAHKVLTAASLLLVHITNIHFAWNAPEDAEHNPFYQTIWGQNKAHKTPFALNPAIADIYWVAILILQVGYVMHLYTGSHITSAANVGGHFIVNNVFMFAFVLCWVHSQLVLALFFLIVNFFNLSALYFRHSTTPISIHIPVVSGPLAWNYVALFWVGACLVDQDLFDQQRLAPRILANIAVWSFLGYGLFFLTAFKDWTMGLNLSILMASLGVHQFLSVKVFALQWIFAFTIMGILFVLSAPLAISHLLGKQVEMGRGAIVNEDRERQPLLDSQNGSSA